MIRTPVPQEAHPATTARQLCAITEAAATATAALQGHEDKNVVAQDTAHVVCHAIGKSGLSCQAITGDHDDELPSLMHNNVYGGTKPPRYDLVVNPAEDTTFVSRGQYEKVSIAALGHRGDLMPSIGVPHKKLIVGPKAATLLETGAIHVQADPVSVMRLVAEALHKNMGELTIATHNHQRNDHILRAAEQLGARVILLTGGDTIPALHICTNPTRDEIDLLLGTSNTQRTTATAVAVGAAGGNMQIMPDPLTQAQSAHALQAGILGRVFDLRSLVGDGALHFVATGITPSAMLSGAKQTLDERWYPGSSLSLYRPPKQSRRFGITI